MENYDIKEVMGWFSETPSEDDLKYNVIAAEYENGNYEGDAFVLLEKNGQYFEVHGSHCSCFGLEDQWGLEETTIESIQHRIKEGRGSYGAFGWCIDAMKKYFETLNIEQ